MISLLGYLSFPEQKNLIRVNNCGKPVRDHDDGLAPGKGFKCTLNQGLCLLYTSDAADE